MDDRKYHGSSVKVPKTSIEIVKGNTTKEKTLFIKIMDDSKKELIISKLTNN